MNYFPFDPDPRASAIALDDKRLTRVFHEATMTLSKAQFMLTGEPGPYSPKVPVPAPLMTWVAGDGENWFVAWTHAMMIAMVERYGQTRVDGYASFQRYCQLAPRFRLVRDPLPMPLAFPNFARAVVKGLDFTHMDDTHAAYREYIRAQWNGIDKKGCCWGCHGAPVWAFDEIDAELRRLALI